MWHRSLGTALDRRRVQLAIGATGIVVAGFLAFSFGAAATQDIPHEGNEDPISEEMRAEAEKLSRDTPDACGLYTRSLERGEPDTRFGMPDRVPQVDKEPKGYLCYSDNLTSEIVLTILFDGGAVVLANSDEFLAEVTSLEDNGFSQYQLRDLGEGVGLAGNVNESSQGDTTPEALFEDLSK